MSMYIRLKRRNSTVFLHVDPAENIASVKERLSSMIGVSPESVLIISSDRKRELVDLATISDQNIGNDEVVFFVLAKENGGWEEVAVEIPSKRE